MSDLLAEAPPEAAAPEKPEPVAGAVAAGPANHNVALTGIFVLLVFYTIYFAAPVLIPITVSFLLSLLFSPFVDRLESWRIPRLLGSALIMLSFVGLLVVALVQLAGPAQEWVARLPASFHVIEEKLRIIKKPLQDFQKATEKIESAAELSQRPQRQKVEIQRPGILEDIFSGTQRVVASIGVILILTFALLASGDFLIRKLTLGVQSAEDKKRTVEVMRSIQKDISYYLAGATLLNLSLGLGVGILAWFMGLSNAALWGAVVAVLAFAPYVGSATIMVILTLVGLLEHDTFGEALILPAIFLAMSTFVQTVMVPFVLGRRLLLSPVAIFIAIILWGWMWGIIGALLAVPLLASFKLVCERIPSLRSVADFLTP